MFFACAAIFFVTQLRLAGKIRVMEDISDAFDLAQIPLPGNELSYNYYDNIALSEFLFPGEIDIPEGSLTFLNQEALDAIPDDLNFDGTKLLSSHVYFSHN